MKLKCFIAFAALIFVCFVAPASASVIEYNSMPAFNAAVTGETTYNFEGIAPAGWFFLGDITVGGVAFTDDYTYNRPFVIDANVVWNGHYGASFFSGQSDGTPNSSAYVTATLAGVSAIGFSYGSYTSPLAPVAVTLSTGNNFTLTTPAAQGVDTNFVGFTSNTPITSVTFELQNWAGVMDITNFVLGTASITVPEPATMLLLGIGLMGLAGARRKFKE